MGTRALSGTVAVAAVLVTLAGCGAGGSTATRGGPTPHFGQAAQSVTSGQVESCSGERYARKHLPSEYASALRKAGWKYFGSWARVGQVAVVNVVSAATADSHERAVLFVRGDEIIGADAARPAKGRFDARICSVGRHSALTGYLYRMSPTGPDASCPTPRPAFATVRWQVDAQRATPMDRIPGQCK